MHMQQVRRTRRVDEKYRNLRREEKRIHKRKKRERDAGAGGNKHPSRNKKILPKN